MTLSAQLTHFGVHTTDLDRMVDFYKRVMGFVVSDSGTGRSGARVAFMTQNPECHHQFVLFDWRPPELAYNPVNQISFRLDSLDTLKGYRRALLKEGIGEAFTGTSNVLLAMDNDLEALGTNAHELPMVFAALAKTEKELKLSPYKVLQDWQRYYGGNLLIVLPDAFGTASFLRKAPDWIAEWTGFRPDSAPPIEAGEKVIEWWRARGKDPKNKLLIFSDGLDVEAIEETYKHFRGKVRMAFGWGTNLTNDFEDCAPTATPGLTAISLVCKVTSANGRPAVKLSDNPAKATGDPKEIARYIKLFGETDRVRHAVKV